MRFQRRLFFKTETDFPLDETLRIQACSDSSYAAQSQ